MASILFDIQAYVSAFIFLIAAIFWHTNGTQKSKSERVITISYLLLLILLIRCLTFIPLEISKMLEIAILFLVLLGAMILAITDYSYYRRIRKEDLMTIIEPPEDIPPRERTLPSYAEDEEDVMKWEFAKRVVNPYLREMEDRKIETEKEIEDRKRESEKEINTKEKEARRLEENIRDKEEELNELQTTLNKKYDALKPTKEKLKKEVSKSKSIQSLYRRKMAYAENLEENAEDQYRSSKATLTRAEKKEGKADEHWNDVKEREKRVLDELTSREKNLFVLEDKLQNNYKEKLREAIEAERNRLRSKHMRLDNFEMNLKAESSVLLARQDDLKSQERNLQALMSRIENEKEKSKKEEEKLTKLRGEFEQKKSEMKDERKKLSGDLRKVDELEEIKDEIEKSRSKVEKQKESVKLKREELATLERKLEDEKDRFENEKSEFIDKIKDFGKKEARFEKEKGEVAQRLSEIDLLKTEINEKEKELRKEREKVRILQKTIRSETFK